MNKEIKEDKEAAQLCYNTTIQYSMYQQKFYETVSSLLGIRKFRKLNEDVQKEKQKNETYYT